MTKGANDSEAVTTLIKILKDRTLLGGSGLIKGSYKCVCFCETPLSHLAFVLANRDGANFKYRAFGVMFSKEFIYKMGGRPVIYGEEKQFDDLPEAFRYRHVLYDPFFRYPSGITKSIDLTWEREWRLKTEKLNFSPKDVTIVCPSRAFVQAAYENLPILEGEGKMPWHFAVLEDSYSSNTCRPCNTSSLLTIE
jgi:hypothetical protein